MIFIIEAIETKGEGWKVATLREGIEGGKTTENVSINKFTKGTQDIAFAKFDEFAVGMSLEGELWRNPSGRTYLFAPKPKTQNKGNGGAFKAKQIEEAQNRTAEHVEKAQDNKNWAIQVASAQRDAVLMVTTFFKDQPFPSDEELQKEFKKWREFFLTEGHNRSNLPF